MFMSVLLWGAKNWTQCFRGGLTWAKQSGRITSLNLLGNALPNIAQDAVGCLCFRGARLAHGQFVVYHDPQVIFCKVTFQLFDLQPILLHRVIPPLVQDFVELHEIPTCPFLQAVAVLLDVSTSGLSTTPPNYVPSINLLRTHSVPPSKLLIKWPVLTPVSDLRVLHEYWVCSWTLCC